MNAQEIKLEIRKKFGTIKKFTVLANLDYQGVIYHLSSDKESFKETKDHLLSVCKNTPYNQASYELNEYDCKRIREAITTIYGTLGDFVGVMPNWSFPSLSALLNGRTKRVTYKVRSLIVLLVDKLRDQKKDVCYNNLLADRLDKIINNK